MKIMTNSDLKEKLAELSAIIEQVPNDQLEALIAVRGVISQRIAEIEGSVHIKVEAEGTIG